MELKRTSSLNSTSFSLAARIFERLEEIHLRNCDGEGVDFVQMQSRLTIPSAMNQRAN